MVAELHCKMGITHLTIVYNYQDGCCETCIHIRLSNILFLYTLQLFVITALLAAVDLLVMGIISELVYYKVIAA